MSPAIGTALTALVALIHVGIAATEMTLWPRLGKVHRDFGMDATEAKKALPLAQNTGLYNAFLAAGLIACLVWRPGDRPAAMFFLGCVAVAGIFGAATLPTRLTLLIQTLPATLALLAVAFAKP